MVNEIVDTKENIFLINAPAGSGKTTRIKEMLSDFMAESIDDNILCITYTNRAAEELAIGMDCDRIFFGTIHSFINTLISPFLGHKEIVELYWEIYEKQIINRINNLENKDNIKESNQKYIDKYGELSIETLKENIRKINYNETSFNSLYYGGLCHDDLLIFAKEMIDRYPVINKKIVEKYKYIFIDEYQDTSATILRMFYESVQNTSSELYLLGDRMQQIYKNYDGSFEEEFKLLNDSISLKTNHRSVKVIIDLLNKIYNDKNFNQELSDKNIGKEPDHEPKVIITKDIEGAIKYHKEKYKDSLILFLLNNDKFKEIGASNLYASYGRISKYSFASKNSANDVLSDDTQENIDPLMKFLFSFDRLMNLYQNNMFGDMFKHIKTFKEFYCTNLYSVTKHEDKIRLLNIFNAISSVYFYEIEEYTIIYLLNMLKNNNVIHESFVQGILEDEYEEVLKVNINELKRLSNYLKDPQISTQHGVKGESHTSVLFVATDNNRIPIVNMYKFFEIWSQIDFSLSDLENFYYEYMKRTKAVEEELGLSVGKLTAETHNKNEVNKEILRKSTEELIFFFKDNKIFELLCKSNYDEYLNNSNLKNLKPCFKPNVVYGVLMAYKLFYVGCSRARKNLTVLLDKSKVSYFEEGITEKFKSVGFTVESLD